MIKTDVTMTNEHQVFEYAVDGGEGKFKGLMAFIQIQNQGTKMPKVQGFLATYRAQEGEGPEFRLTKRDIEMVEALTVEGLDRVPKKQKQQAIVIHLKEKPENDVVRKIVIYPESDIAELLINRDAPIACSQGYYDRAHPHRFSVT